MSEPVGSNWADEIEEGDSSTLREGEGRHQDPVVTEYMFNEDGKKVKVVRTYEIERKMVLPSLWLREEPGSRLECSRVTSPDPILR